MEMPERWPRWPVLPVKNPTQREDGIFPKCGVMVEDPMGEVRAVVYLVNLFAMDLKNAEKITYRNMDELLDAGWIVD
jgi:hypothetical protein